MLLNWNLFLFAVFRKKDIVFSWCRNSKYTQLQLCGSGLYSFLWNVQVWGFFPVPDEHSEYWLPVPFRIWCLKSDRPVRWKRLGSVTRKPAMMLNNHMALHAYMTLDDELNSSEFYFLSFKNEDNNNAWSVKVTQTLWGWEKMYIGESSIKGIMPCKYYQGCYFVVQL